MWLAEMYEPIDSWSATSYKPYQSQNYSYHYTKEVTIISSCQEHNIGVHGLQLCDYAKDSYDLPMSDFNILTISCKGTYFTVK
jgi:hypothetical protein